MMRYSDLIDKCNQKLLDHAKESATDAFKIVKSNLKLQC